MALLPRSSQGDYLGYDCASYLAGTLDLDDVTHAAWVFADQINVFEADLMSSPAVGAPPVTYIGHVQFDNVTSVGYMGESHAQCHAH